MPRQYDPCQHPHCGGRLHICRYVDEPPELRCYACGRAPKQPTAVRQTAKRGRHLPKLDRPDRLRAG